MNSVRVPEWRAVPGRKPAGGLCTSCPAEPWPCLMGSSGLCWACSPGPSGAVGAVSQLRDSAGLGWGGGWRPCPGPVVTAHARPLGVLSSAGMTEHTKNLLRAFYELSQTHRGKGALKLAAGPQANPCPSGLAVPHIVRVWPRCSLGPRAWLRQTPQRLPSGQLGLGVSRCWKVAVMGAGGAS